jgi:hypothetical protein
MARYRHQLMGSRAGFGQTAQAALLEAMETAAGGKPCCGRPLRKVLLALVGDRLADGCRFGTARGIMGSVVSSSSSANLIGPFNKVE